MARQADTALRQHRVPTLRIVVAIALALVAAALVWFLLIRDDDDSSSANEPAGNAVTLAGLRDFAASENHPVYWAGAQGQVAFELTKTPDGRVYIRYLPEGEEVGVEKPFLTVGTYPYANAYDATAAVARKAQEIEVGGGGVAFTTAENPGNVYLAYPGQDYQIEVFDPSPARAESLVVSGKIKPIIGSANGGATPTTSADAVSLSELRSVADSSENPIYWAGNRRDVTYELTQTPDGRTYLRYLPAGIQVGEQVPVLTIGTYALPNAFRATNSAANASGAVKIPVDGGVAFYSTDHPESVYYAKRGSPVQIEVFAPDATQARRLIASGKIRPVP